jgi:4-alpha-glucanotransferase
VELGYLSERDLAGAPEFPADEVVYDHVMAFKFPLLRQAAENFREWARPGEQREFEKFCSGNAGWLDDYALFMALKEEHGGCAWTSWKPEFVRRQPAALEEARQRLQDAISARKYWQFEFSRQWQELRAYCRNLDIQILGDIPIYVAHDSADVWAHPELFHLDAEGNPTVVAGVPPDYFSETGQLWGNPIYRWEVMARTGYGWWIERFRANRALVDILRLDHFRGFQSFWEVPATEKTAVRGRWVMGPREALFREARKALGELPLVAENLGVITPDVEELRQRLGLPGMAVLQFAFGSEGESNNHRPHNFVRDLVAYSGTHDNDTTVGWWTGLGRRPQQHRWYPPGA